MKHTFAGRKGGTTRVSAEREGGRALVSLEDDGIGIPEGPALEKAAGFGLMLIRSLARQLEFELRIERGHGTRFVLEFDARGPSAPPFTRFNRAAAMGDRHDRRYWILKRCPAARDHSLALMSWAEGVDALHLLNAIFFHSVQGMSQMLLLADLRDPTVKKSLVKARGVLENYGMEGLRGRIMHLLGADRLSPEDIRRMALDCRAALVEAVHVFRTPFEADNAISACMLPSIETEARDCIEGGFAAEILLWIAGLHSLSMYVIENDSDSPSKSGYRDSYVADMGAMGLGSVEEARGRLASARSFFDEVTRACEAIASSNPRAAGTNKEP